MIETILGWFGSRKRKTFGAIALCWLIPWSLVAGSRLDSIYAFPFPERTVTDVLAYELSIEPNGTDQSIKGENRITMRRIHAGRELWLDLASELVLGSLRWDNENPVDFYREGELIRVALPEDWDTGKVRTLTIPYSGKPRVARKAPWDGGVVWSRDKNGKPFWGVACQGDGARIWYPCKDFIQDPPEEVLLHITVADTLKAIGNGRLAGVSAPSPAQITYSWKTTQTIHNYNLSWYVGDYVHFAEQAIRSWRGLHDLTWIPQPTPWHAIVPYRWISVQHNGFLPFSDGPGWDTLTLDYYVLRPNLSKAKTHFLQVREMMEIMEHQFGPYPFAADGYKLVEAPYLGMEHQSAIAYGNYYLSGYMGMDHGGQKLGYDYILIHESGHEWWGNNVAMKTRADMWINEGFCTYSDALYVEHKYGYPAALDFLNYRARKLKYDKPILGPAYLNQEGSADMYDKGAMFLHTLRYLVRNDTLWFAYLKALQRDLGGKRTSTDELLKYSQEFLGLNLKPYFVQYLGLTFAPTLFYHLQKNKKGWELTARWDSPVPGFALPLGIYVGNPDKVALPQGDEYQRIVPTAQPQTWQLPADWSDVQWDTQRALFTPIKDKRKATQRSPNPQGTMGQQGEPIYVPDPKIKGSR